MATDAFHDIETEFARLSPEAQLSMIERLVHCVRVTASPRQETWDVELGRMAADPEMRRELTRVNGEFFATESDGLERR